MCLKTTQQHPKVAETSIPCLKLVKIIGGKYCSPFSFSTRTCYPLGETVEMNHIRFDDNAFENPVQYGSCYEVERGIASFVYGSDKIEGVMKHLKEIQEGCLYLPHCDFEILECEIPIGARYYEGFANCVDEEAGYTSDKLKVLRIYKC